MSSHDLGGLKEALSVIASDSDIMKALIVQNATGMYLGRGKAWTRHAEAALAFVSEIRARDFSIYHRLTDTRVVMVPRDHSVIARSRRATTE
jgi:hypothetical protein